VVEAQQGSVFLWRDSGGAAKKFNWDLQIGKKKRCHMISGPQGYQRAGQNGRKNEGKQSNSSRRIDWGGLNMLRKDEKKGGDSQRPAVKRPV